MKILDMEQGSPEWHAARLGIPTASRFKEIITPAKGEKSKQYKKYLYELLAERVTGEREESHTSEWMIRGTELEDAAREAYAFIRDMQVQQVGFVLNDEESIGVSPDGLIGEDGGLEIKCPKASTVMRYIDEDRLPDEYKPQVQGCLWITGRAWWDFVVYHPSIELWVKRIYRDEVYIEKMRKHIGAFVLELEQTYQRVKDER